MNKIIKTLFLVFFATQITAQTAIEKVIQNTDVQGLKQLSEKLRIKEEADRNRAIAYSKKHNIPLRWETEQGEIIELRGIDEKGFFDYVSTTNLNAAKSLSIDKVWTGGITGYNLNGAGITVGIWDGGATRVSHQEFQGRATQMDGAGSISSHATHVSGTVGGGGVSANAIGMAWQSTLHCYDWSNDGSEMSSAAASGLLISNHSYGTVSGWRYNSDLQGWDWYGDVNLDPREDWKFGYYDNRARTWDEIAQLAPYYLIVKSAGNDRNDNHNGQHRVRISGSWTQSSAPRDPDGQFDCMPTYSNSKNILTVGAVNDVPNGWNGIASVSMSSFSGWGPTDDGRIKPDIVGNGVSLISADSGNDQDYGSKSGTSMSGPNVSGGLALIQEHYQKMNESFMRSATLKALVIHTADEAGNIGPDYSYGWGLMNVRTAADVITDQSFNKILEETLTNNEIYSFTFNAAGNNPIRASIAWTDVPGPVSNYEVNPTDLRLINDLDVRLINQNTGISYTPYILDPSNPNAPATNGDNFRDNVEQIFIEFPDSGMYEVRVTHKGTLVGTQAFSLVISGMSGAPAANFIANQTVVCEGDSVQFLNFSSGNPSSFEWIFQGGIPAISTDSNPKVFYPNPGNYPVELTVTKPGFTGSTQSRQNFITVSEYPDATILDTLLCTTSDEDFEIKAATPGGSWLGFPWLQTTQSATINPSTLTIGLYPLTYTVSNEAGCTSRDSVNIEVRNGPLVNLFLQIPDQLCTGEDPFELEGGIPSGGNYFVNGFPDVNFYPGIMGPGMHEVSYEYTDAFGCTVSKSAFLILDFCSGLDELNLNSKEFIIYPNPNNGLFTLSRKSDKHAAFVSILDITGRVMLNTQVIGNQINFNVNQFPKGMYFIQLINEAEDVFTEKFILK